MTNRTSADNEMVAMRRAAFAGGWNAAMGGGGTGTYQQRLADWERDNALSTDTKGEVPQAPAGQDDDGELVAQVADWLNAFKADPFSTGTDKAERIIEVIAGRRRK